LSNKLKNKMETILQLLNELKFESTKGVPIIVEGQKDVDALKELGINGNIISAKTSGKSFVDLLFKLEEQKHKEIILLLDFDRRGKEWTKRLKQSLEQAKIKPNIYFWNRLKAFLGRDVKDIESLTAYLRTLQKKSGD
jgi:5S rRNA maturation endonuclease (ribonuclease M5)